MFNLSENGIDKKELYKLANEVERQFIRTESDELTYPIHILIRYERNTIGKKSHKKL